MLIAADENIPFVKEAFGTFGEIITFSGREINNEKIRDRDILLVRSVTRVNRELLQGTKIKFVATATIGTDHIDTNYLNERNIGFSSSQGSNAASVAEYVMAALLCLGHRMGFRLSGKSIGVIGVGNVGSKVVKMARGLGMKVMENDPPLARKTRDSRFREIWEVINSDIVTFHVPLTREGQDATFHMVNERLLSGFKKGVILINTSRGTVAESNALYNAIRNKQLSAVVLDVWENEPNIDSELLKAVDIATPHIAGYSFDGKVNGTSMIYNACADFFKLKPTWKQEESMPETPFKKIEIKAKGEDEDILWNTIRKIYDIEQDDKALRMMLDFEEKERGFYFDSLRKKYPVRREFFNTVLKLSDGSKSLTDKFAALGFKVETSTEDSREHSPTQEGK